MSQTLKSSNLLSSNLVVQIAILVNDIDTSLENWCKLFGVKNYGHTVTAAPEVTNIKFKGESTPARAKLGFIKLGQVTLEIIEPDHNPSVWREYLDEHGEGFHHIAFNVDNMEDAVANFTNEDMALIQSGEYVGGEYAYMDTADKLKMVIELLHYHK